VNSDLESEGDSSKIAKEVTKKHTSVVAKDPD